MGQLGGVLDGDGVAEFVVDSRKVLADVGFGLLELFGYFAVLGESLGKLGHHLELARRQAGRGEEAEPQVHLWVPQRSIQGGTLGKKPGDFFADVEVARLEQKLTRAEACTSIDQLHGGPLGHHHGDSPKTKGPQLAEEIQALPRPERIGNLDSDDIEEFFLDLIFNALPIRNGADIRHSIPFQLAAVSDELEIIDFDEEDLCLSMSVLAFNEKIRQGFLFCGHCFFLDGSSAV
jgi:hypothetical protein